jgi:hypothetical protein
MDKLEPSKSVCNTQPQDVKSPHKRPGPSLGQLSFVSNASSAPSFACATSRAIEEQEALRRLSQSRRVQEWVEDSTGYTYSDTEQTDDHNDSGESDTDEDTPTPVASRAQLGEDINRSTSPCAEKAHRTDSKKNYPPKKVTSPQKRSFSVFEGSPRPHSRTAPPRRIKKKYIHSPTQSEYDASDSFSEILARFPKPPVYQQTKCDLSADSEDLQTNIGAGIARVVTPPNLKHLAPAPPVTPPNPQHIVPWSSGAVTPPNPERTEPDGGPWSLDNPPLTPVKGHKLRRRTGVQI